MMALLIFFRRVVLVRALRLIASIHYCIWRSDPKTSRMRLRSARPRGRAAGLTES
jgi:hypothetical protein